MLEKAQIARRNKVFVRLFWTLRTDGQEQFSIDTTHHHISFSSIHSAHQSHARRKHLSTVTEAYECFNRIGNSLDVQVRLRKPWMYGTKLTSFYEKQTSIDSKLCEVDTNSKLDAKLFQREQRDGRQNFWISIAASLLLTQKWSSNGNCTTPKIAYCKIMTHIFLDKNYWKWIFPK